MPTVQVCAAASSRSLLDRVLIDRAPVDDLPGRDRRRQVPSRRIDVHGLELADLKTIGDDGGTCRSIGQEVGGKGTIMDQPNAGHALKEMEVLVG